MHPLVVLSVGMLAGIGLAGWWQVPFGWAIAGGFASLLLGRWLIGVGLVGACLGLAVVAGLAPGPLLEGPVTVHGTVVGAALGRSADVYVYRSAALGEPWAAHSGRVRVWFPETAPRMGTEVLLFGYARPLVGGALPGAPDPVAAARRARVQSQLFASKAALVGVAKPAPDGLDAWQHGPVLRALATGNRSTISESTWGFFRRTGIAHLLAISGFHVGLVAGVCGGLVLWLLRSLALIWPQGFSTAPAWIAGCLAAFTYAWGAGAPVSAQRAALALLVFASVRAAGRDIEPLTAVAGAALVVMLVDPSAVATPGFQLSFGAVLGLVYLLPWLTRWFPPDMPRPLTWIITSLSVTLAATAGTLPAAAWWFGDLAPLAPVANLIAIPVVALVVVPAALGAVYAPPSLATWCATLGNQALSGLLWVLAPCDVPPLNVAIGPLLALAGAIALIFPGRTTLIPLVAVALLSARVPDGVLKLTLLDVGQGDAMVLHWPDGRVWLVDGGPPSRQVASYLRRAGLTHLDAVVVSHGHEDHIGGLPEVLNRIQVDTLLYRDAEGLEELLALAQAKGILAKRADPALWFPSVPQDADINDRSAVVLACAGPVGVLLPGDAEHASEAAMMPRLGQVSVLKVGHHGSRTSSSEAFLQTIDPAVAVASMGRGNRFGHPHAEVVDRYRELGIPLFRTDRDGTIEVTVHPHKVSVQSWLPGQGWRHRGDFAPVPTGPEVLPSACLAGGVGRTTQRGE